MNFPHVVTNIRPVHNTFRAFNAIVWVTNWVWAMMYIELVENICLQIKLNPFAILLILFSEFDVIQKSTFQLSIVFFLPYYLFLPILWSVLFTHVFQKH